MKIIVDAMGGDNAPQAPVLGALQANKEYGVDVTLVGRGEEILKVLKDNGIQDLPAGVEIANASEVIEICDDPSTAFRSKPRIRLRELPGCVITSQRIIPLILSWNIWKELR